MDPLEDASKHAGYAVIRPATRLANAISAVMLLVIVLIVVGTLAFAVTAGNALSVIVVFYGVVAALSVYVTFGWLEQTLRLLIGIAYNTAEGAGLMPTGESED